MQNSSQEQNAPFSFGQTDDIEVDLASPWARMGAVLLNTVFWFITILPMLVVLFQNFNIETNEFSPQFMQQSGLAVAAWLLLPLAYGIWQLIQYSKHGQTLGKKIVGIRLIKEDGSNPGFVGAILLREVVYGIIIGVLGLVLTLATGAKSDESVWGDVMNLLATLACVIMMFAARDRRTLQDMLAKTVVIKLPKKHR
ncbi:RDD family protein [Conchiformibius kuhniae]|uniref:RDD family protein n=1 Tax=Conchiformibius kuhniae TaxID=211502 RepID=A0A8T9MTE7_9NEIS|nr:RDD family protein [Conchiformibius kuhniae]UOP04531.1 RDD family protein [Conchiformibius kuhniae]